MEKMTNYDVVKKLIGNIRPVGDATLLSTDKAMLFMRWIRKALDNNTFETVFIS